MKILELVNTISIAITNEEAEVLDLFEDDTVVQRQDLSPRQVVLANQLVNKDIALSFSPTTCSLSALCTSNSDGLNEVSVALDRSIFIVHLTS